MATVGIDLGTTYSVVATPQTFEGEFFERIGGVSVIANDRKLSLIPSVVGLGAQGDLRVGQRAKALAGQTPEPIFFAKRFMGQDMEFELGEHRLRPEEVSAYVLEYLKDIAEKQMGEPIDQAVITVPAYFTTLQKQLTKEAGKKAGLNVSIILQEPVAAALTFCHNTGEDDLTIMTYDLGGGTFDVAVIQKQGRVFNIRSFAGDRHLGGQDFDKRLAQWILTQLIQQGYNLPTEPAHPQYSPIMTKLMVIAESIKVRLSQKESYNVEEAATGIVDLSGRPVEIQLEVKRSLFESLIEDYIEQTIHHCWTALESAKPPIKPEELDAIVMVGGSSYIPAVSARLWQEFKIKPHLFQPNLAVAIGAALQARLLERQVGIFKLSYIPEVTSALTIDIDGELTPNRDYPDLSAYQVGMKLPDGQTIHPKMGQNGFMFMDIPLIENAENVFSLYAQDAKGRQVAEVTFTVWHDPYAEQDDLTVPGEAILAKPISFMTASGQKVVIAPEHTPLPSRCSFTAQTADQAGQVVVLLCEEHSRIGEIVIDNVPENLEIGTQVEVDLYLREDFYIEVAAHVPSINRRVDALIQIPLVDIKTRDMLVDEYRRLRNAAEEALDQADKSKVFKRRHTIEMNLEMVRRELEEDPTPNLARVQEKLDEVYSLIVELTSQWTPVPPTDLFEKQCEKIDRELLPALEQQSPGTYEKSWEVRLANIRKIGQQALKDQDDHAWAEANRQLGDLHDQLLGIMRNHDNNGPGSDTPPDPQSIRVSLGLHLTELRSEVEERNWLPEFGEELDTCSAELHNIDATAEGAMAKLARYYQNHHEPLVNKINSKKSSIATGRDRKPKTLITPDLPKGIVEQLKPRG